VLQRTVAMDSAEAELTTVLVTQVTLHLSSLTRWRRVRFKFVAITPTVS
jgi:hypothetical protein